VLRQEIVRHVIHFFAGLRRGYPAPRRFETQSAEADGDALAFDPMFNARRRSTT
jgi:hypothetical protein